MDGDALEIKSIFVEICKSKPNKSMEIHPFVESCMNWLIYEGIKPQSCCVVDIVTPSDINIQLQQNEQYLCIYKQEMFSLVRFLSLNISRCHREL